MPCQTVDALNEVLRSVHQHFPHHFPDLACILAFLREHQVPLNLLFQFVQSFLQAHCPGYQLPQGLSDCHSACVACHSTLAGLCPLLLPLGPPPVPVMSTSGQ